MKEIVVSALLLCSVSWSFGQVVGASSEGTASQQEQQKEGKKKEKKEYVPDGSTTIYALSNWSRTNRLLQSNDGYFGDTLGERANETFLDTWSFSLGFRNKINSWLTWDGGISYLRNGESYHFAQTDSSFSYQTTYSYIGMPVRLNYTIGEDIQWFVGAGLLPQMFLSYNQEQRWRNDQGSNGEQTIDSKSGYNSFVLSALFNTGIILNFKSGWGVMVSPEIRLGLTSTYLKQDSYIHKGRAYGISFGLTKKL